MDPGEAPAPEDLGGEEMRASARSTVEVGDTSEEAVNVNDTTPT